MVNSNSNFSIIVAISIVLLTAMGGFLPIVTYSQMSTPFFPQEPPPSNQNQKSFVKNVTACNCVVFRMDDIQGHWIVPAQLAPLNLFISKNQSLSLGLIMNFVGNSSIPVVNKVREGSHKGLFELALHGWNHVDYTKLRYEEQKDSLRKANEKMLRLFGNTSDIFISPYDKFNNDTLKAMSQLGLRIFSSGIFEEKHFDQNGSIFVYDNNHQNNSNANQQVVYHLPATSFFKDFVNGKYTKIPIEKILSDVDNSIKKYGYAVILFHPQDFVTTDEKGKIINQTLDLNEINDLSRLIDAILSKNIHITSFSKIVGIEPKRYSETNLDYS